MNKRVREAAADEVVNIMTEFYMTLFAGIESRSPDYANELRPDYAEFMRVNAEVFQDRQSTIDDVFKRLPRNKWVDILKLIQSNPELLSTTPGEKRQNARDFRAAVQKRLKGRHHH